VPDTEPDSGTTAWEGGRYHEGVPYAAGRVLDIRTPPPTRLSAATAVPVVILLHGCCGDRSDLGKLSEAIVAANILVFTVDWAGMDADASFPANYEDIACAVGFARAHAHDLGGDPERVILAGWSDGAMAAAVVAAAADRFDGARCLAPGDPAPPLAVVGISGFYGWPLPVPDTYVTSRSSRLFGGGPEAAPENWAAATPYAWLALAPPTLLLVGTTDPLLEDARRYAEALDHAGRESRIVAMPPAGDQSLISPRTPEGRQVVEEIAALGRAATAGSTSGRGRGTTTGSDGDETWTQ
jgi:acetyl esterase/lipase